MTEAIVRAATVGMKEGDTHSSAVLDSLFAPLSKKRVKEIGLTETEENKYVGRLSADVDSSGSVDKIALGMALPRAPRYGADHKRRVLRALRESPPLRRHTGATYAGI